MSASSARSAFIDPLADYGEVEADQATVAEWALANGLKGAGSQVTMGTVNFARSKAGLPRFKLQRRVLNGVASERVEPQIRPAAASPSLAPSPQSRSPDAPIATSETELLDLVTGHNGTITGLVTPQVAGWLLALNTGNRPLSGRAVDRFIAILRQGAWQLTGEPVIISRDGVLNDGQHRLAAVQRSGIPALMDLRFGIARQAFAATGTGTRRTTGNVLAIAGTPDASMQAAIGRLLVHHQAGQMQRAHQQVEPHQVIAATGAEPAIGQVAALIRGMKFRPVRTAPFGFALVLASRTSQLSKVEQFAAEVDSGKTEEDTASRRLHVRLRDAAMAKERLHQVDVAVLVIRAWNAWIKGRSVQMLKVLPTDRTGDGFPKVISGG